MGGDPEERAYLMPRCVMATGPVIRWRSPWPSLSRPSTPRRVNDESDIAAGDCKGLQERCFWLLRAYHHFDVSNTWVAGTSPAITLQAQRARQAGEVLRFRIRASQPRPANPIAIIAQVEGSGTAFKSSMSIELSPLFTPAVRTWLVIRLAR
jgi:hypothetical protein